MHFCLPPNPQPIQLPNVQLYHVLNQQKSGDVSLKIKELNLEKQYWDVRGI